MFLRAPFTSKRRPGGCRRKVERLRKPRLEESSQLRGRLELRNGFEFLERRSESIRETPRRARSKVVVPRLEVEIMNRSNEMLRRFQPALDERVSGELLRESRF